MEQSRLIKCAVDTKLGQAVNALERIIIQTHLDRLEKWSRKQGGMKTIQQTIRSGMNDL